MNIRQVPYLFIFMLTQANHVLASAPTEPAPALSADHPAKLKGPGERVQFSGTLRCYQYGRLVVEEPLNDYRVRKEGVLLRAADQHGAQLLLLTQGDNLCVISPVWTDR